MNPTIEDTIAAAVLDALQPQLDRIEALMAAQTATKPFYTVPEAATYLRKRKSEIEKLLTEGRLWILEGLDSSQRLIPQAALDSLQERGTRSASTPRGS